MIHIRADFLYLIKKIPIRALIWKLAVPTGLMMATLSAIFSNRAKQQMKPYGSYPYSAKEDPEL